MELLTFNNIKMIKNRQLSGDYGTHFAPLIAALTNSNHYDKDVIEFGMGDFSTLIFHEFLKIYTARNMYSYDNNHEWIKNFEDLKTNWHSIDFVDDWNRVPVREASVVLIDHAPAERRVIDIERFAQHAQIIVVHDTDKPDYYGYTPVFAKFKYQFKYERYAKSTTLLSNFIDVTKIM